MAFTKGELAKEDEPQAKKARAENYVSVSSVQLEAPRRVVLNPADCDLDFNIEANGLLGYALYEQGFAYCWSGARANVGITGGKYCFGCKVICEQPVDMEDTAPGQQHVCRIGISRGDDMVGNLGESKHSFGHGGTGKFSDYAEKFGIGDTVVCCVDLENKALASMGFYKNGKWLDTDIKFDASPLGLGVFDSPLKDLKWESALFPHVLLKNVVVQMQFSVEDGLVPKEGFKPWTCAIEDRNMIMGPAFSDPRDCEVIMMVGLPASGKTTWAEKWVKEHPEKRYVLLGTNLVLDQMKVPGLLRKNNYVERFDRLMNRATGIYNVLMSRAASTPRNYIIDQTNLSKNARKRKLKPFADYQKFAVVVFPKPEELKIRSDKRFKEIGNEVPPDAVHNMLANFVLPKSKEMPHSDEYFDQVIFVEVNRDESQKYLDGMKKNLTSISKNNSSTFSGEGSSHPFSGHPLQNQGNLTDSGVQWQCSYSLISPSSFRMASQVNAASQVSGPHGSMNSFSGVCPSNQNLHQPTEASSLEPYSNNETTFLSRENAGYYGTYSAVPRVDIGPYCSSEVTVPYSRPNIIGSNMVFPGPYHNPHGSGMDETPPVANARTLPSNYNTAHGGPDVHALRTPTVFHIPSQTTYDLPSSFGTPPPGGNFPDSMQYFGRYQ